MSALQVFQRKLGVKESPEVTADLILATMERWNISAVQACHFFGQCAHETGNFRMFTENLNYSANALIATWPSRFKGEEGRRLAESIERKPELIANHVYGGRMGNVNTGDGWRFIGRGALQTTGRENYQRLANFLNRQDIMTTPTLVATEFAFESAQFFFNSNNLWRLCEAMSDEAITALTRRINGGTKGLQDRIDKTRAYFRLIRG